MSNRGTGPGVHSFVMSCHFFTNCFTLYGNRKIPVTHNSRRTTITTQLTRSTNFGSNKPRKQNVWETNYAPDMHTINTTPSARMAQGHVCKNKPHLVAWIWVRGDWQPCSLFPVITISLSTLCNHSALSLNSQTIQCSQPIMGTRHTHPNPNHHDVVPWVHVLKYFGADTNTFIKVLVGDASTLPRQFYNLIDSSTWLLYMNSKTRDNPSNLLCDL